MENIKKNIYNTVDKLKLSIDKFKLLGIAMVVYAGIKLLLFVVVLVSILLLSSFSYGYFYSDFEFAYILSTAGWIKSIIIIPMVLVFLVAAYIEIKAGLVAIKNWDKPKNEKEVIKWRNLYIMYVTITVLYTLIGKVTLFNYGSLVISIILGLLYFYFSEKLSNSDNQVKEEK